jgi:hypothetical protein
MGLATIAYVLKAQTEMLKKGVQAARTSMKQAKPVEQEEKVTVVETVAA